MNYIRTEEPDGGKTVIPVASIDFVVQADEVTVYMKSGRTLTLGGEHAHEFIDILCNALDTPTKEDA